jgi:hypothetical protein
MAKGSGGTIYLIGLIFAIIVAFVLLGIAYVMNTEVAKLKDEIGALKRDLASEKEGVKRKQEEIDQLNILIHGDTSPVSYETFKQQYLGEANRKLQEMLNDEWLANEEWRSIKDENVRKVWEGLTQFKDKADTFTNLIAYQTECLKHLQAVIHTVPALKINFIKSLEDKELINKQIDEIRTTKDTEIADLRDKLAKEQDRSLETARKSDADKRRLTDQIEKLNKEQSQIIRDNTIAVTRLENDVKKRDLRIQELTKKQRKTYYETARPDGEVTFADAKLGTAWIDLGRIHGLRRGTRFQCYTNAKGGHQRVKAMLEVKKVDEDSSECAILGEVYDEYIDPDTKERTLIHIVPDDNDPVVKGDLLRSPIFERNGQPKFYFLGKAPGNRYYNKEELEKKIEGFGGKLLKELSVDVDFVVVFPKGEEDFSKDYEKAVLFGVTFMKEEELLEYVGK